MQTRALSHGAASSSSATPMRPVMRRVAPAAVASCSSISGSSGHAVRRGGGGSGERRRRPALGGGRRGAGAAAVCRAIEEKRDTTGEVAQAPETLTSEIERLAALRRADGAPEPSPSPPPQDNPLQGALSEARLITWPRPQKALLDTALVLGIVSGTSALVFGLNVALAELAGAWYKSH